jgi:hypothetical protein
MASTQKAGRSTGAFSVGKSRATTLPDDPSLKSLYVMLDSVKRDANSFFGMGKFEAKKKLPNGAVVKVSITMPAVKG